MKDPSSDNYILDTGVKILFWYFFSVISPVTNKWVQVYFQHTNTLSILHLITASVVGGLLCYRKKENDRGLPYFTHPSKNALLPLHVTLIDLLPLGIAKFIGMMLLLFGLKNLPVSLVLTMKALDPIPTSMFTYFILNVRESKVVYSTVIPIILGVILSTNAEYEVSFGWALVALMLVIVDSLQNVITKYLLKKGTYTEFSLQFLSSSIALFFQFPVCLYYEGLGPLFSVLLLNVDTRTLFTIILTCTAFYGQVIMAFLVMNRVTNLTYSIANILKRVIQLLVAVVAFGNHVTASNAVGMLLALAGISLYTIVKSYKL